MIYLTYQTDGYETWNDKVFDNEEMAKKYCDIMNQLDEGLGYSWHYYEFEISTFNMDSEVKPYYSFYIGKDDPLTFEDITYWDLKDYVLTNSLVDKSELERLEELDRTTSTNPYNPHERQKAQSEAYMKSVLKEQDKEVLVDYINQTENRYENDEETTNRIYDTDLYVEETSDYIEVYSTESYQLAKETALNLYEDWKCALTSEV